MLPQRRLPRLLYHIYAYYAIFIGVTCYRYDGTRRRYQSTGWSRLVVGLANIWTLVVLPLQLFEAWSKCADLDMVTKLTVLMDTTVNDVICLLRVLQRVPRERATRAVLRQLERLQRIYRYGSSNREQSLEVQLERIYLAKNLIIWLLAIFLASFVWITYNDVTAQNRVSLWENLMLVYYALVLNGQNVTMHLHFMLSRRVCQLYSRLNKRIGCLLSGRTARAVATLELQQLRWQHCELARLLQRLNVSYSFIMLSTRFSLIVTAAALGYYLSVLRAQNFPVVYEILGFGLYALIALECYILDLIYDLTMNAYRETTCLLRAHNELQHATKQLDRECELFALQIACLPLKIEPYGLYNSGRATWLSNIACICSWITVLLQYRLVWAT